MIYENNVIILVILWKELTLFPRSVSRFGLFD